MVSTIALGGHYHYRRTIAVQGAAPGRLRLVDRSLLIEMNQPKPETMAELGRKFLRKMGLTGDEVEDSALHAMAAASRGSLRDFGNAVVVAGLKLGGAIPTAT